MPRSGARKETKTPFPGRWNMAAPKTGELFRGFSYAGGFLNRVTGPHRDSYVKTPEYKVTAVRIEKENIGTKGF